MKILAVDYGDSRTGLATCDRTEFLTTAITPQITLKARNKVAARVCEVAKEIGAELIVIGLPLNMDGTEANAPSRAASWQRRSRSGAACLYACGRAADHLRRRDILDESGTFGTKRKEILDSVSATVILDDYLAWRKEHPGRFDSTPSVIAGAMPLLPFCHLRDIFPRPGEVFLTEGGFGIPESFPSSPEAPSPRELSSECETEGVLRLLLFHQ